MPRHNHGPLCPCGKPAFRSYRKATKWARRLPIPGRVYYCPRSGGWHITSQDLQEYARARAATGATLAEEARNERT